MVRRSSRSNIRVDGAEEVIKQLKRANAEITKEIRDLISKAAEIVFREADSRAPIGKTGKTRFSLEMNIGISQKGNYYANVSVGARNGDISASAPFYVTFYEYGSSHQPPRPFMRPSLDKSRAKVRKLLIEGVKAVVERVGA
ncbi:HK97-gp10 family putative phage morphogenesis protein [Paenibacillus sp. FSL L8-0708]|uniref:HK97-gp10 family putative phage morphogenesis protein n=1 Tax=Paenibacillus sp. FSL L8-0708 TaxID=2975311 RepID=UPI0030F973A3